MNALSKAVLHLPPEQQAIRGKCFHPSGSFIEFKMTDVEQPIADRFEQIVAKYPNSIALKTGNDALTYKMLNQAANRLARAIMERHKEDGVPVAVLLKHNTAIIVGILGTFKTDKICVPLDPAFHENRTRYIFHDCQAKLVVTDSENLSLARQLAQDASQVINIDEIDAGRPSENLGLRISPDAFAYILYTSGSTGQPKGVVQSHRNLLYDVRGYTNSFHICADDRLTLFASCSGGEGMKNTLSGLLNGATVYQWNIKNEGFAGLASWLVSEKITIWISTPIIFRNFVTTLSREKKFTELRLIRLGSGAVYKTDVGFYKNYLSRECILVNWLSSTESGNFANYFIDKKTEITGDSVPVGYGVEAKEVFLFDDNRQEVGVNQIGELAVKSRYLCAGYWRRPDLTKIKFWPDPNDGGQRIYLTGDLGRMHPDGCLEYLGRKDLQVKVRGYRFEVTEVEKALLELSTVKEAVVVAREDQDQLGAQRLIAYLVLKQPASSITELRNFLKDKLPDYMVPSAFVFLDELPLGPNGKMNRSALPDPGKSRPNLETAFVAPTTTVEKVLSQICAEVLKLDRVGVHDNFFDLGGHSLLAAQIISKVLETLHVELHVRSFFEAPTVAGLAKLVEAIRWTRQGQRDSIESKENHEQGDL